jgi:hypothetical protein
MIGFIRNRLDAGSEATILSLGVAARTAGEELPNGFITKNIRVAVLVVMDS